MTSTPATNADWRRRRRRVTRRASLIKAWADSGWGCWGGLSVAVTAAPQ
jgi:hypothetical protein